MNPTSQQIAIAKACKWSHIENCNTMAVGGIWRGYPPTGQLIGQKQLIPHYLHSLDAMHEAERMLPDLASDDNSADQLGFCEWLASVVGAKWGSTNAHDMWLITHATAAQRAEAFLRTLNLWEDNP